MLTKLSNNCWKATKEKAESFASLEHPYNPEEHVIDMTKLKIDDFVVVKYFINSERASSSKDKVYYTGQIIAEEDSVFHVN